MAVRIQTPQFRPGGRKRPMSDLSDLDVAAIEALEARRCKALAEVDLAALDIMFSDTLTHGHATGLVQDKAGFLAGLEVNRPFIRVDRGPLHIHLLGDFAVVTGPMTNTVSRPGQAEPVVVEAYATQVLAWEGERWRYIAFQATSGPKLPQLAAVG